MVSSMGAHACLCFACTPVPLCCCLRQADVCSPYLLLSAGGGACCSAAGFQQPAASYEGLLLACASKAASHLPLLLPPTAALAAALEMRGLFSSAAAALRYCLALLQAGMQSGPEGLAALGLAPGQSPGYSLTHRLLLVPPSSAQTEQVQVLEGSSGVQAVVTATELALARNLCLAGDASESVALYQRLEAEGALSSGSFGSSALSYSWLAYGAAAQQAGEGQLAIKALQAALDTATQPEVQLAAVTALLQVRVLAVMLRSAGMHSTAAGPSCVCWKPSKVVVPGRTT